MTDQLRVGLKLIPQLTTVADLQAVWQTADQSGFDHCWVYDHILATSGQPAGGDVLDGWSLLAAMAALTSRVRIGVLVTGNSYRHPGMLAKIGSTVDHLSGGRLEMGIGAGWAQREFTMLDLPFGTAGQRISQLSEACKILKMLWSDEPEINFEGRHYRLVDAISNPKPVQRPHPPLWVGGRGVKKLLRVAAEEADVWNTTSRDFDEEVQLSKVLDRHCEDIGRDPSTIRRSMQLYYRGDVEDFLGQAKRYRGAGFTEIVVTLYVDDAPKGAETVATEILPRLRELG